MRSGPGARSGLPSAPFEVCWFSVVCAGACRHASPRAACSAVGADREGTDGGSTASGVVSIPAVVHIEDDDLPLGLVDQVADPIFPATRPPQAFERRAQGNPYEARFLGKRTDDELPRGEGGRWGERGCQRSACPRRKDDAVRRTLLAVIGHVIRAYAGLP